MQRAAASRNTPNFVQELFNVAVLSRATDVHVEPIESAYRIRLRVDGVCTELVRMTSDLSNEFFARIKVLAEMDVTERRRPQDGSLRMTGDGRQLDLRLSTLPTRRGEKLAIRIADGQSVGLNLAELGLSEEEVQKVRDVARRPHGLLLTTGPVGSGKTTTLYSC
jgi:type IV pilus assembly protein PilB